MSINRAVQFLDPRGRIVGADEAHEAGGRVLKPGYGVRKAIMLVDGAPVRTDGRNILGPDSAERAAMKQHLQNAYKETR
jgi:hypothetical protein